MILRKSEMKTTLIRRNISLMVLWEDKQKVTDDYVKKLKVQHKLSAECVSNMYKLRATLEESEYQASRFFTTKSWEAIMTKMKDPHSYNVFSSNYVFFQIMKHKVRTRGRGSIALTGLRKCILP